MYQSYTYIPILQENKNFSLYTWANGAGKSSVLQALDSFFNNSDRHINQDAINKKRAEDSTVTVSIGVDENELVHLLDWLVSEKKKLIKMIWKKTKNIKKITISNQSDTIIWMAKRKVEQISWWSDKSKSSFDYIFNIDINYKVQSKWNNHKYWFLAKLRTFSSSEEDAKTTIFKEEENLAESIFKNIYQWWFNYVYIPAELTADRLLNFSSDRLTSLLDKDLFSIIDDSLNEDNWKILKAVNKSLKWFISNFTKNISKNNQTKIWLKYPERKKNLVASDLRHIILESYFYTKYFTVDNKKIDSLSSWEQREAIIDIICQLLLHNNKSKNIIFAIDEPENSMHISNKLKPFEKLYESSLYKNIQVLVTTHWYWVIPTIDSWSLHFLQKNNTSVKINSYPLESYQEQRRRFPDDIYFKCYFDLASNILSTLQSWYNWLLCEWSDDRLYCKHFLWESIDQLKIMCLWGAPNVIKMYKIIFSALIEEKNKVKSQWKILCLIDTDTESIRLDDFYVNKWTAKKIWLDINRLQIKDNKIKLLNLWKNWTSSKTVIEDCLVPKKYYEAVATFINEEWDEKIKDIFNMCEYDETALVSKARWEKSIFKPINLKFLDHSDALWSYIEDLNNKYKIANIYCSLEDSTPKWTSSLVSYFNK